MKKVKKQYIAPKMKWGEMDVDTTLLVPASEDVPTVDPEDPYLDPDPDNGTGRGQF